MNDGPIRVRFAPSPTGDLHVGNARTALFNWLFARHAGGRLLLRIEDTDRERSRPEHERQILADLRWLGLGWDEGIDEGGEAGPYRQSERSPLYEAAAARLLDTGAAYRCFCPPALLEEERTREREAGRASLYSGRCRDLARGASDARAHAGEAAAIRFDVRRVARDDAVAFDDLVHGPVRVPVDQIGDFVLLRRDGGPAYNFAVVVDDDAMRITHVIRGDDHLSNTPRQILVARGLGVASPLFAHLPLLVAPGGAPLSKREGAVSVRALREAGYPPEAVLNHLALLGWSPPGGVEVLTREELITAFDLVRVSRSPAVFDRTKLDALANRHLQRWDPARLASESTPVLQEAGLLPAPRMSAEVVAWSESLVGLVSDRLSRLGEIPGLLEVVFAFDVAASLEDEDVRGTLADPRGRKVLTETVGLLEGGPLTAPRLQTIVAEVRRRTGSKGKDLFHPIRVGLTGFGSGPELVRLLPVIDAGSRLDLPRPVPGCAERARALLAATEGVVCPPPVQEGGGPR